MYIGILERKECEKREKMNFELLGKNLMKNVKNICVENYKTLLRLITKILNNQKDVQ